MPSKSLCHYYSDEIKRFPIYYREKGMPHTRVYTMLDLFSVRNRPFFPYSSADGFPSSHFLPHSHPCYCLCCFNLCWLSSHSFQREGSDSWLRLLSSALSGWVTGLAASVLSCVAGSELGVHSYFTWETSGLSAFFGNNCFYLKSRKQKSNNWKLSTFRLLWHQVSFELCGGKRREILFEKG